jgi:hypothetical protein
MTPNFYHNLLSTDIQPSNKQIADHCSITACFKVGGLTGADMNLEPQHDFHGGCPIHNLRWNFDFNTLSILETTLKAAILL